VTARTDRRDDGPVKSIAVLRVLPILFVTMVAETIQGVRFPEGALDGFLQAVDRAVDRLVHHRLLVCHDDRLVAVATHLDHAALVVMAGLVGDGVAELHVDAADASAEPVQRAMHNVLHMIGKRRAAVDIAVRPHLNQHDGLRRFIAWCLI